MKSRPFFVRPLVAAPRAATLTDNRRRRACSWLVASAMLVAACSSGTTVTSAPADASASSPSDPANPDPAADGGTGEEASSPSAPTFLSMSTDAKSITEGGTVTFVAILTDPEGLDDIAGGTLKSPAGDVTYGGFASGSQKGSFILKLTWLDISKSLPIEFTSQGSRDFTAEFFDAAGHRATRTVTLKLDCSKAGGSACDGACIDLTSSQVSCGKCGHVCKSGQCMDSACTSTPQKRTPATDCNAVCAGIASVTALPFKCESTCKFTPGTTSLEGLSGTSAVSSTYCEALTSSGSCLGPANAVAQAGCSTVPAPALTTGGKTYTLGWEVCCCVAR